MRMLTPACSVQSSPSILASSGVEIGAQGDKRLHSVIKAIRCSVVYSCRSIRRLGTRNLKFMVGVVQNDLQPKIEVWCGFGCQESEYKRLQCLFSVRAEDMGGPAAGRIGQERVFRQCGLDGLR